MARDGRIPWSSSLSRKFRPGMKMPLRGNAGAVSTNTPSLATFTRLSVDQQSDHVNEISSYDIAACPRSIALRSIDQIHDSTGHARGVCNTCVLKKPFDMTENDLTMPPDNCPGRVVRRLEFSGDIDEGTTSARRRR